MKQYAALFLIFTSFFTFGQGSISTTTSYPTNYFSYPLEIPLVLAGTFGELRSNHFHAGLDIKTEQREGLNVIAAANGYVSRIKIAHGGYGKAIYVRHPNGYTTVYAHLQKFNNKIETYIKKQQYKKESFEIQVFPSASELPISKDEILALSGNTGSSGGPHLHFEIRDTKTEKPINPMSFGIEIADSKKPRINNLVGYSFSEKSHINKSTKPILVSFRKLNNGDLIANRINAFGKIGFGVNTYDQLDNAYNKNGLYSLKLSVNGKPVHEFKAETFSFSEGKYINLLIDYERYKTLSQRVQKCFTEPSNRLDMYDISVNSGYIKIEDGLNYTVEIIAKDFKGNTQKLTIPIIGKKDSSLVKQAIEKTSYKILKGEFNKFSKDNVTVAFPKNTFYNDFYLDFKVKDTIVTIHKPIVPLNKRYTLTFDVSKYTPEQKKQLYIATIDKYGKTNYQTTVKKETTFYTSTKTLGKFTLATDNTKPSIRLKNIKNEQWLTHFKTIQLTVSDKQSGIKSYRGEIDGKWILMEYDAKKGTLTYNLNDKAFAEAKHQLKVVVTDNVGNSNTLNTTFFRKK